MKDKIYWMILISLITCSVFISIFLLVWPNSYETTDDEEKIINEMIYRTEAISINRDKLNIISITPFMWDEGFVIDCSLDKDNLLSLSEGRIQHMQISEDVKRLVFFYKGKQIADLFIGNELIFDIKSGTINQNDGWLNIDIMEDGTMRLFR